MRVTVGNWQTVKLVDIANVQTGISKSSQRTLKNPIELPYLRVANVQDGFLDLEEIKRINIERENFERYSLRHGDVLLTEGGDFDKLGRGTIWRDEIKDCVHQNHVFVVRTHKKKLLPEYLSLLTSSDYGKKYFVKCSKQSTNLASINSSQLKAFPVLLPRINIQQAIVNIFQTWDTAIEKTEALIAAKELQFGWLKSKLLLKSSNAKHWKNKTLGQYIDEKKGKSTVPDLYPCLTSSRRGMFLQDEYFSKQVASKDNTGYKIMSRGDFTFRSMSDDGTFVFNQQNIVNKGLISPAYGVFAPNKAMDADFLYYFLNSSAFKRAFVREVQGGTRTALKLNVLERLDVDMPELSEQQSIANILNTARQEITLLQKLVDHYRMQKRGLMQKLLSGAWQIKHKEAI